MCGFDATYGLNQPPRKALGCNEQRLACRFHCAHPTPRREAAS